ncbi:MAG TPA: hypothetical protein VLN26_15275 [Gaiellaceae bacterium]|nr:hypothetical protein [Gaiellaceae bacterium]
MKLLPLVSLLAALGLAAAGCGGEARVSKVEAAAKPAAACRWQADWQKLANRIRADVYCPNWLPDPLTGQIGGQWNNIDSVSRDRSYLEGFVWQETGPGAAGGELHVNLRGYPGSTKVPTCDDTLFGGGKPRHVKIPCFADPRGQRTINGIHFTVYTVNQGADQWHVLYGWHHDGGLYTVSEHVAPPLDYAKVVQYLNRITRNLVLVRPQQG